MNPPLKELLQKYAVGTITEAETRLLETEVRQLETFQQILHDRQEWELAMAEFIQRHSQKVDGKL